MFLMALVCEGACAQSLIVPARVTISSETVSTLTETSGGDYLIPDSQIFIGGKNDTGRFLGLLGVVIDTSRNASAIGDSGATSKIKFDSTVHKLLTKPLDIGRPLEVSLDSTTNYDVKLLPSARLLAEDGNNAHLSFRLTARIKEPASTAEITKNYHYGLSSQRPLIGAGGWFENNALLLKNESLIAFDRLLFALGEEISGRSREALKPEKRRLVKIVPTNGKPSITMALLAETNETIVVVPMIGNNLLWSIVQVIDKSNVRVEY